MLRLVVPLAAGAATLLGAAWLLSRTRTGRRTSGIVGAALTLGLVVTCIVGAPTAFGGTWTAGSSPGTPSATWTVRRIGSGPGYAHVPRLRIPAFPVSLRTSPVRSPSPLPAHGIVGSVVIPATRSHFTARPALVYLPPAARVPQPGLLPVIVAFSGQSRGAGPLDLERFGHLRALMDGIASKHGGVAPIVVVPDQLGPASGNPMCVDSKRMGHVATYVLQDVRRWILGRLPIEADRRHWTVAGFSEGGTCAIQFAAARPDVFGSLVDVSGENAPANGDLAHTIAVGFGGSRTSYLHATPAWLLAHHRYVDEDAYFAAGARDRHYGPVAPMMARRAATAGMTTYRLRIPRLGHNWRTAQAGLRWAFTRLVTRGAM